MNNFVRFTYSVDNYVLDVTDLIESEDKFEKDSIRKLFELLRQQRRRCSKRTRDAIQSSIFELIGLSIDIEISAKKTFSKVGVAIQVNQENSELQFAIDDDEMGYRFTGDIYFTLPTKKNLSQIEIENELDATGGIELPAFSCKVGNYACDSGSQVSWEILNI